jgi:hypothetical protein
MASLFLGCHLDSFLSFLWRMQCNTLLLLVSQRIFIKGAPKPKRKVHFLASREKMTVSGLPSVDQRDRRNTCGKGQLLCGVGPLNDIQGCHGFSKKVI